MPPEVCEEYTGALRAAIGSGAWDAKYGELRRRPYLDGSLVLIRAVPDRAAP